MFKFFNKVDNTDDVGNEKDVGKYAMANKAIGLGNRFGMQDAMRAAFLQGLPDSLEKMIGKLRGSKERALPSYFTCQMALRGKKGFVHSLGLMGVDMEQVEGILEDVYNKMKEKEQ